MIVLLIIIIIINFSIIFYLWKINARSKARHLQKTAMLQAIIVELVNNYDEKKEKIAIAEEIKEQLKLSKDKLNADILSLQYEFLETLTRNGLVE